MSMWEDGWAEYGYDNASYEEKLYFRLGWKAGSEADRSNNIDEWLALLPSGWKIITDGTLTGASSYIIRRDNDGETS